jgi:spermidine synthase
MTRFQEELYEHHKQMLSMETVLYHWRTEFQDVLIFENAVFGKVLVLDGIVQLTERDNHIYHEMIAHVPLMAHGSARDVLIIGGGDGGTLKEVLKHPIKSATPVELDGEVIDLSRRYLPEGHRQLKAFTCSFRCFGAERAMHFQQLRPGRR